MGGSREHAAATAVQVACQQAERIHRPRGEGAKRAGMDPDASVNRRAVGPGDFDRQFPDARGGYAAAVRHPLVCKAGHGCRYLLETI